MALSYPMALGLNKGHKVTKKTSASRDIAPPHQAHQVRGGHDPGGVRLRALRVARCGAAQSVQGQGSTQVYQREWALTSAPREKWEELSNVLAAILKAAAKKD